VLLTVPFLLISFAYTTGMTFPKILNSYCCLSGLVYWQLKFFALITTEVTIMMIVVVMLTMVTLDLFLHLRFVECAVIKSR